MDNNTQSTYKNLKKLFEDLKFKHHFTSVEHPKTNEQAETTNKLLLKELREFLQDLRVSR